MPIIYDPEVDVLRILFQDIPVTDSDEDETGIIFDFDAQGNVIGLAVLDTSKRIDNPQFISYTITKSKT